MYKELDESITVISADMQKHMRTLIDKEKELHYWFSEVLIINEKKYRVTLSKRLKWEEIEGGK